jgi:spore coat polysaccharide biosynthesis protein SpsF (cytidylyltransferase family)
VPKIVGLIQARMGSSRFPGKSLAPFPEMPLLDLFIKRIKQSKKIDQLVLISPSDAPNDVLGLYAKLNSIEFYNEHQDENDLVGRFYYSAKKYNADYIVRLCADNPFVHASEVDRLVDAISDRGDDFISNCTPQMGNGYPDGIGAEIFSLNNLEKVQTSVSNLYLREHVHLAFEESGNKINFSTIPCPKEFSFPWMVLDVNTEVEYNFLLRLLKETGVDPFRFTVDQIAGWYRSNLNSIPETYKR